MRRGLISRSKAELPDAVLDARIARVRAAMGAAGLDVRHHLVVPAAGFHRVAEHGIGVVRHLRRAPQRRDLRRQLMHEQPIEQRGGILEREAAALVREPMRQETERRGSQAMIGHPLEPRTNGAGDVRCETDFYSRRLRLGTLGFGGAVEEKLGRAVR